MSGRLARGDSGAARSIVPVTPSDVADLPNGISRGILIGTAGPTNGVTLTDASGTKRDNVPLQQGWNPIAVKRIWSTGTDATNIWAAF
jgi:hypothetical protein